VILPPLHAQRRGPIRWLVVVCLAGLVVRVLYVLVVLRHYVPVSDAHHYHTMAIEVAAGHGVAHNYPFDFLHHTAWRPPLYPLLLGGVYAVTGPKLGAAAALNVVLGTAVVVMAAIVAWRLAGRLAGVVAGVVAAFYPPLVFNDGPPLSEPLGLLFLLVTILLVIEGRLGWAGVASGLLVLSRASGQFFVLSMIGWVLWRLGWRRALAYVAGFVLMVSPWAVRNWIRLGSPVLVTSNGFNLNAIYSPEARAARGFVDAVFDPRFAALREGITNEVELDAKLRRHALASLRDDPMQVVGVVRGNLPALLEIQPWRNWPPEAADGRNLRLRDLTSPLVVLIIQAGVAGMWLLRRRPGIGPLVIAAVVFSGATLVSVNAPRLRAPLDLVCCITAGAGVGELARRLRDSGFWSHGADVKRGRGGSDLGEQERTVRTSGPGPGPAT
jgi:4-amino-4-deoxy-L-arabinose transferase-like glycosyltransferase